MVKILRSSFLIFVFFFSAWGIAGAAPSSQGAPPSTSEPQQMEDFNITGYGVKGEKTWDIAGASMDMVGKDVNISDITAHLYGEKESMLLTADEGRFDKETGVVRLTKNVRATTDAGAELKTDSLDWSQRDQLVSTEDQVNITKGDITATGQGIQAHPDFKVAKLEKDVKLTLEQKKKESALSGKAVGFQEKKGRMTITCDGSMELDYEKQYATFEKNVKVEGDTQQGVMIADKMTLVFDQDTKQIKKMVAQGNVKIIKGENVSESDGAIFTAQDKKLVLTGRPKLVFYSGEGFDVSP
jgi:LPS export ABC transporter protein LptC